MKELDIYRNVARIRALELLLNRHIEEHGFGGFWHPGLGQEGIQAGAVAALREDDYLFYAHRGLGYALAKGMSPVTLLADLFGTAPSEGTLTTILADAATRLTPVVETIREGVRQAALSTSSTPSAASLARAAPSAPASSSAPGSGSQPRCSAPTRSWRSSSATAPRPAAPGTRRR